MGGGRFEFKPNGKPPSDCGGLFDGIGLGLGLGLGLGGKPLEGGGGAGALGPSGKPPNGGR